MAKKKDCPSKNIIYQETYNKGTVFTDKEHIIKLIKTKSTMLFAVKAGKYENGKEFITLTIDNIENGK
jgi:hypothetical protein